METNLFKDKRVLVEIIPGPAFLVGNALGGIFAGAILAAIATGLAIVLRWRWDRALPLFAISVFGLTLVMLTLGLAFNSATFIKVSNSLGGLLFAAIIAGGMLLRPSLLERTFGRSIRMRSQGWRTLHLAWIAAALLRVAANEFVWRTYSDQVWAVFNGLSDIVAIFIYIALSFAVAHFYWDETATTDPRNLDAKPNS